MTNAGDEFRRAGKCRICTTLAPAELIELDLILGDPLRWPVTVWKGFSPPEGGLPASYRRFGAENMGREWLLANGFDINKQTLRSHIRYDVPLQSVDVDELIQRGLISLAAPGPAGDTGQTIGQPIDALAYITLYNEGIHLGIRAQGLIAARVDAIIKRGEEVPLALLKLMVEGGMKLAQSQAQIKAAGKPFGDDDPDEDDAFRGGDDISPRMGHSRIRTVDGEARPVADQGFADRQHYNDRAAQEGGDPIGGR